MTAQGHDRERHGSSRPTTRASARIAPIEGLATVRELLAVPGLRLTLAAGAAGLDRPVRWAHAIELVDPRPYLRGQELVLTMGSVLVDAETCRRFVAATVERDAGGIGFGCGNYQPSAPVALREACEAAGIPLVEVPFEVPFIAITEELAERMASRRAERDRRALRREAHLLDLLATGRGIDGIVSWLARELGGAVAVAAPSGVLEAVAGDRAAQDVADATARSLAAAGAAADRRIARDDGTTASDLVPIRHRQVTIGWLGWLRQSGGSPRVGAELLREAAPIVSIALATRAAEETRERQAVGRLLEIVRDGVADPVVLAERLAEAGLEESGLVGSVWPGAGPSALRGLGAPRLIAEVGERTVVLSDDADRLTAYARAQALTCGVGSRVPLSALGRSLVEAEAAAAIAANRGGVATWRDLATVSALLGQQTPDGLAPFVMQLVVPLVEYDARHATDLLGTLRAFIAAEGAVELTARQLHLHANSLRHRLRRIRAITGRDPAAFLDRIALYVGLWAWDARVRRIQQSERQNIVVVDD